MMSTVQLTSEMQKAEELIELARALTGPTQKYIANQLLQNSTPFDPMNYTTEELNIELIRRWEDYKTGRVRSYTKEEVFERLAEQQAKRASE